jgi:hypothetical protein
MRQQEFGKQHMFTRLTEYVPQAVHAILLAVQRLKYQTLENSQFRADDGILWAFTLMKYPI